MTSIRTTAARTLVVGAALAVGMGGLAGCSSQKILDKAQMETKAQAALVESTGGEVPPVTCPSDIEAKVGATTTCTITSDEGDTYNVTITITSVNDATNDVNFDVEVADTPNP